MSDLQLDFVNEIEALGEIMQAITEESAISGNSISHLGDAIIRKCEQIKKQD